MSKIRDVLKNWREILGNFFEALITQGNGIYPKSLNQVNSNALEKLTGESDERIADLEKGLGDDELPVPQSEIQNVSPFVEQVDVDYNKAIKDAETAKKTEKNKSRDGR